MPNPGETSETTETLKLLSFLRMDVFALTRQLVDIESVTGNEGAVGEFLHRRLRDLGYDARLDTVEPNRFNVYAVPPKQPRPEVFFSTHMDTVPPFFPSREDETRIYGRGACDAKGIIAAQIGAAEKLRHDGLAAGLLFVVGEERNSAGAKYANQHPAGGRFLIDGEPTDNRLATATKGAVRAGIVCGRTHGAFRLPGAGRVGDRKTARRARRVSAAFRCRATTSSAAARSISD